MPGDPALSFEDLSVAELMRAMMEVAFDPTPAGPAAQPARHGPAGVTVPAPPTGHRWP